MKSLEHILKLADKKRKALKMSAKDWTCLIGVNESTYYRWLSGHSKPSLQSFQKLVAWVS